MTYTDYTELGYSAVTETEFPRYLALAEGFVRLRIQNRLYIKPDDTPGPYNHHDPVFWATMNQRGLCEIIDLFFIDQNPNSDFALAHKAVTSFSNMDYSESYGSNRQSSDAEPDRKTEMLGTYFTAAQLWRGF